MKQANNNFFKRFTSLTILIFLFACNSTNDKLENYSIVEINFLNDEKNLITIDSEKAIKKIKKEGCVTTFILTKDFCELVNLEILKNRFFEMKIIDKKGNIVYAFDSFDPSLSLRPKKAKEPVLYFSYSKSTYFYNNQIQFNNCMNRGIKNKNSIIEDSVFLVRKLK